MIDDLLEVWRVHDDINLYLLRTIPEEGFSAVPLLKNGQPSTGRTVARNFAHMHEVRASHVGRELLKGMPRFESDDTPGREELLKAFEASGKAVAARLAQLIERKERLKHRPGVILLGYLISHESHHRGQLLLALKQSGIRRPEQANFGIWEHWFRPKLETASTPA